MENKDCDEQRWFTSEVRTISTQPLHLTAGWFYCSLLQCTALCTEINQLRQCCSGAGNTETKVDI